MVTTHPEKAGKSVWKSDERWTYTHYHPDMDPNDLPHFAGLIALWQGKRKGRRVPSWGDFDFYDFKGWHGWLSIYDVSYDPFDWVLRLSGTEIDTLFEQPMTGMTLQDRDEIAVDLDNAVAFCEITCNELLLAHTKGPINIKGKDYKWVELLELPCSDHEGRATHTIEAVVRLLDDRE